MWKRGKPEPRPLVDWDKIERLVEWNHNWDPPGELSTFYEWDDTDLKWVESFKSRFGSPVRSTSTVEPHHQVHLDKAREYDKKARDYDKELQHYKSYMSQRYEVNASRVESAVMEVRTNVNTIDLEELKTTFGWSREVDWHSGMQEFIQIHGERIRVSHAQAKLNNHFGRMYLRIDGRFGPQTANLLHKLDTTHRI